MQESGRNLRMPITSDSISRDETKASYAFALEAEWRWPDPYTRRDVSPSLQILRSVALVTGYRDILREWIRKALHLIRHGRFDELRYRFRKVSRRTLHSIRNVSLCGGWGLRFGDEYQSWLAFNRFTHRSAIHLSQRLAATEGELPKLSVIMTVHDAPLPLLERALTSVQHQLFGNWDLTVIAHRNSAAGRALLSQWEARDTRIRVLAVDPNDGIVKAINRAVESSTGVFMIFMDSTDMLSPDALGEFALHAALHPATEVLYADNDRTDNSGLRHSPEFKPDWSPELLLSHMYLSRPVGVSRRLFDEIGKLRDRFEACWDYDLMLRATERAQRVGHIPRVLYHRGAGARVADRGAVQSGAMAVQEALHRRGSNAAVHWNLDGNRVGFPVYQHEFPDDGPSVAIVIPTKNHLKILKRCLNSLSLTTYTNYQVVVIDNESDDRKTLSYLHSLSCTVMRIPNPSGTFNFSHINNRAAERVDAEYLLFLNNDTEVITPRWLSRMIGYARMDGVGAVGALLVYPRRGTVQHAGIIHGATGGPEHIFRHISRRDPRYKRSLLSARNTIAVTAACMLTPRAVFHKVGDFDEKEFRVEFQDPDYCVRLRGRGLRSVCCPGAIVVHHECYSRGYEGSVAALETYRRKYWWLKDPYVSPHLVASEGELHIQTRRIVAGPLNRFHVLMCCSNLNGTDSSYRALDLAVALKTRGTTDPQVYSPTNGALGSQLQERGVAVHIGPVQLPRAHTLDAYEGTVARFVELLRRLNVGVIYANSFSMLPAVAAAVRLELSVVWAIPDTEPRKSLLNLLPRSVAKLAFKCLEHSYRVVFDSHSQRAFWAPHHSVHNVTVIDRIPAAERTGSKMAMWSKADSKAYLSMPEDSVVILMCSTTTGGAGLRVFGKALDLLPAGLVNQIECVILKDGNSPHLRHLSHTVASMPRRIRAKIRIVHDPIDTALYYRGADIFVCPDRLESHPASVLEALAFGLPTLMSATYGVRKPALDARNVLIYPHRDVKLLSRWLARLVEDPDYRRTLGDGSREGLPPPVEFDRMMDAYEEIFQEAYLGEPLLR